jgi:iron complex outermembrane recepter protein
MPSRVLISLSILLACAALTAAQATKRPFDLPATFAEKTLRMFSAQSGLPLLFRTDVTKGVRTQAVRGDFSPHEALDKMLAGTVLVAVYDEKTGSFTIKRHAGPKANRYTTTVSGP